MYRLLTRAEVEDLLSSVGGQFVCELAPGAELWRLRLGFEVVLSPGYDGLYHEYMVV